jgi:hypothetical protein
MKSIKLTVLIAGLFFSAFNSEAQTNGFITNGLIAYYPLNGTPNDASGNGNNGTVYGATLTSDRFGVPATAYQFNGTSDYIAVNIPNLPTNSEPRSISLWAKAQPSISSGICLLFWGTGQNREGFGIICNSAPLTWQGQTWGGGDDVNSGVIVDTNWHQIVVVYSGSVLSISIDGTQKGTLSEGINTPLSPLTIGADTNDNALQFFDGAISDVRIYDRALSSQEIPALYAAESSVTSGIILLPTITFNGTVGMSYSIQYTTNLSTSNWTVLTNIVLQTTNYVFPDTNSVGEPYRFYRVVPQ